MKSILPKHNCEKIYGSGRKCKVLLCVFLITLSCCGCAGRGAARNSPIQSVDTGMGTIIRQTIYADGQTQIAEEVLQNITDLEHQYLSRRLADSELYQVNELAGQADGIVLSERLTNILERCMEVSEASDGAFDITIGETVRLWDIDARSSMENVSDYEKPGAEALSESLKYSGYDKLILQDNTLFLPAKMQLDLGAVGKGIALDCVGEYLEAQEVTGAVISVGGSILTYGQKPDGSSWKVGVINPHDTSQNLGYLSLKGQWCVSTSGDYERFVEVDGVRYHHIIDPATGYPADSGVSSVTILTQDGFLSDALSTACFILGSEKGCELAERFGASALFVDREGNITMTAGMEKYFN